MADTKVIYVIAFAPDFTGWHGDTARVGGFDWRPTWEECAELMRALLEHGETGHDYVFRSMQVPRDATRQQITELLNGELHDMLEVPIPAEWVT